jgi:hypothetical protein
LYGDRVIAAAAVAAATVVRDPRECLPYITGLLGSTGDTGLFLPSSWERTDHPIALNFTRSEICRN